MISVKVKRRYTTGEKSGTPEFIPNGERLYGDDFSYSEIERWFEDEREAYYRLSASKSGPRVFGYHAVNWHHAYRFLQAVSIGRLLGIGSAFGDELEPIASRASDITILEPSKEFKVDEIRGRPVTYIEPNPSGEMPFSDESFDVIVCLEVLHHIPNVSKVVREIFRCISRGGHVVLREPVISMGDWTKPRRGLTYRERGIPLKVFRKIIRESGFEVLRESRCMFSLMARLRYLMRAPVYSSRLATTFDAWLCALPIWSTEYHARNALQKLRPWSVAYVLRKPF